jgi:hypothetical protein
MAGNFKVGMTLTAKDDSSAVLVKGLKLTTKAAQDAQKAIEKSGDAQQKSNEQSAKGARSAAEEARRLASARENLGVRAEKAIQREIDQTIASYNRLTRSGVASARDQDRAFRAMKDRVRELKTEMNGVSRLNKLMTGGRQALAIGGGIAAGGAVLAQPVARQMSYEHRLSAMANTAFSGTGQAGRLAGREQLAGSIRGAVTYGGGTKEDAADAMNEMLASGKVGYDTAGKWLPQLMKYATASGASALDLSKLSIKAKEFGLSDEQIPTALNMAIAAGKAGNVELKDMARWLAPQMAAAGQAGMKGIDDFAKLLTLNEASGITAGSSDEAANNVVNLLAKLNSREAADSAARIKVNGKGIDLPNSLVNGREKGVDPIETFNRIIDKVVGGNKRYQQLNAQMAGAKNDGERKAAMESMATMLEGSAVGQLVADRQALMSLLAYRNNPAYRKQVEEKINTQRTLPEGQREGDEDFTFMATQDNQFKVSQAANAADFAQMGSVKWLADAAGSAAEGATQLSQEFPGMTTAVMGATTAITAMTAAATAFAGLKFLTGGAAGVGAGSAAAAGGATAAATAAEGATVLKVLGRMAGVATLATSLSTMTTQEEDEASNGSEARWKAIRDKYPQSMIDAAREKYQPWYQFGEGYSTENEQWISQYLADEQGGVKGADVAPSQVMPGGGPSNWAGTAQGQPGPSAWAAPQPLNVTTQFVLDGHVIAEAVNQYNVQDGNRGTGGVN